MADAMRSLRVLYAALDQTVPGTLGGSVHVASVAAGLADLGHEVHVAVQPGGAWPAGRVRWHAMAPPLGRPSLRWLARRRVAALAREISIQQIFDAITSRFNVRLTDLQGKKRTKSIVYPRQVCMHLARRLTRHSLEEIGGYFGGRDHTTVLHAVRTIDQQRHYDARLQALLEEICYSLGSASLDHSKHTTEVSG